MFRKHLATQLRRRKAMPGADRQVRWTLKKVSGVNGGSVHVRRQAFGPSASILATGIVRQQVRDGFLVLAPLEVQQVPLIICPGVPRSQQPGRA